MRICDAIDELAREVGKPKWIDVELNAELDGRHGEAVARRIAEVGLKEAGAVVDELLAADAPAITMDSSEDDIVREMQVRNGLQMLLESKRLAAVESAVRDQFENELRALTDAEQDSKELKSRKRDILLDSHPGRGAAALPGRRRETSAVKDSVTRSVPEEGRRRDLQGPRPQEDRGRQAPPRRPRHGGDPPDHDRGRRLARERTAPRSSPAARRRS